VLWDFQGIDKIFWIVGNDQNDEWNDAKIFISPPPENLNCVIWIDSVSRYIRECDLNHSIEEN
jgi:hypothetical protein